MDISVVMPVYNGAKFVNQAVNSVLKQTFTGTFELIIIEDHSQDKTAGILEQFKFIGNVHIISNSVNLGYPKSMNKGLEIARGKYVVRMDSDDIMHPDLLRILYDEIISDDRFCFVSSRRFFLTYTGIPYFFEFSLKDLNKVENIDNLRFKTRLFNDVGTIYRAEDARMIGFYNTYQRSGMDVDFWFRLYEHTQKPSLTINEPLIGKRHLPDSIIFKKNTSVINEIPRRLSDFRIKNGLPANFIPDSDWLDSTKVNLEVNNKVRKNFSMIAHLAFINFKFGDIVGGYKFILTGLKRGPFSFMRNFFSEVRKNHANYKFGIPSIRV